MGDEAGAGVDEHRGGIDLALKTLGRRTVLGDDRFGMTAALATTTVNVIALFIVVAKYIFPASP